jgi:hypothetical protein
MTFLRASLFALLLAACVGDTSISLADFDTSCTVDADCVAVQVGDICGCDCGNAAINKDGLAAYMAELDDKHKSCHTGVFCDCAVAIAKCTQGKCGL